MLCDRILGNIRDRSADAPIDWIDLQWSDCIKRALRKLSRAGRDVTILLAPGVGMNDGDILWEDPLVRLVVHVVPCEVLVISPASLEEMGRMALELGNLHAPTQVSGDQILTIPDGPVEQVLDRLNISRDRDERVFAPHAISYDTVGLASPLSVVRSSTRGVSQSA